MNRESQRDLRRQEISHVAAQAADWLRIVQTAGLQDDERDAFMRWIKESPLHVKEFLIAYATYRKLDRLDRANAISIDELLSSLTSNVRPIGPHALLQHGKTKARPRAILLSKIAAGLVVVTIPLLIYGLYGTYSTNVGEQLRASLRDGSGVYLNSSSRVRVNFDAESRNVYLEKGQALFEVQRDSKRPFRVHAAGIVIQAVGTQFDVRLQSDRVDVAVVEGSVQVSAYPSHPHTSSVRQSLGLARLSAGEATTIDSRGQIAKPIHIDVNTATSWWQQQLVFERAPLSQIAAEFNRYNRLQLRIQGDGVGRKRFNGVFGARKPESFLAYLARDDNLVLERRDNEVIIRERERQRSDMSENHFRQ